MLDSHEDTFPTISVIIPVFNTENYLFECLESVATQTYTDFEAIVINDGSTDKSGCIALEFAKNDNRFIIVQQNNLGLSEARNTGINLARGRYLTFVDSDDVCRPRMLEHLVTTMVRTGATIVCCGYREFADAPIGMRIFETRCAKSDSLITVVDERQFWELRYSNPSGTSTLAWGKLYQCEVFARVRYREGFVYEDVEIAHRIFEGIRAIAIISEALYDYRVREGSISHSPTANQRLDACEAYLLRNEYFICKGWLDLAIANLPSALAHYLLANKTSECLDASTRSRRRKASKQMRLACFKLLTAGGWRNHQFAIKASIFILSDRLYYICTRAKQCFRVKMAFRLV